jgi:predicted  nucleic acid-binding Zn-ribbon protein
MTETFVIDLLRTELETRQTSLSNLEIVISATRNKMTTTTNKRDYVYLKAELDKYETSRRGLRGEVSALRQAIKRLERSE